MAKQNVPGETYKQKRERQQRRHHVAAGEVRCQGTTCKLQAHSYSQINRNELTYNRELASKKLKPLAEPL